MDSAGRSTSVAVAVGFQVRIVGGAAYEDRDGNVIARTRGDGGQLALGARLFGRGRQRHRGLEGSQPSLVALGTVSDRWAFSTLCVDLLLDRGPRTVRERGPRFVAASALPYHSIVARPSTSLLVPPSVGLCRCCASIPNLGRQAFPVPNPQAVPDPVVPPVPGAAEPEPGRSHEAASDRQAVARLSVEAVAGGNAAVPDCAHRLAPPQRLGANRAFRNGAAVRDGPWKLVIERHNRTPGPDAVRPRRGHCRAARSGGGSPRPGRAAARGPPGVARRTSGRPADGDALGSRRTDSSNAPLPLEARVRSVDPDGCLGHARRPAAASPTRGGRARPRPEPFPDGGRGDRRGLLVDDPDRTPIRARRRHRPLEDDVRRRRSRCAARRARRRAGRGAAGRQPPQRPSCRVRA